MSCSELIKKYFLDGLTYEEIIKMLYCRHSIGVSLRTLKTKELYRRGFPSQLVDVIIFIENEISSSGCSIGYRAMHQRCIWNGYKVSKENVRVIVNAIDPDGVELQKKQTLWREKYYSRGPNWAWHFDGYDKLKPYDFPIHGCIDGNSQHILWLSIVPLNNNPEIVLRLCKVNRRLSKKSCWRSRIRKFIYCCLPEAFSKKW